MKYTKRWLWAVVMTTVAMNVGGPVIGQEPEKELTPAEIAEAERRDPTIETREVEPVPVSVRSRMPRGSKSLRCVRAPYGNGTGTVLFHIYRVSKKWRNPIRLVVEDLRVDVFRVARAGARPVRVNSVRCNANGIGDIDSAFVNEANIFGLWLRPGKRTGPMLVLRNVGSLDNKNLLITFSDGITGRGVAQDFVAGDSIYSSGGYRFDGIDERGIRVVRLTVTDTAEPDAPPPVPSVFTMPWNGKEFHGGE